MGRHDKGTYVCKAENGLGKPDTAAAILDVLRKYLPFVLQMKMFQIEDCLLHISNWTLQSLFFLYIYIAELASLLLS